MKLFLTTLALLAVLAPAARAGNPIYLSLGLSSGTADLAFENSLGFQTAYDHSEYGFEFGYWNLMAKDYALTASGGIGLFSETDKPGDNTVVSDDFTYSQSSWKVRLGGDRVVRVGDRAFVYFGPGIEYWSGKSKNELGAQSVESNSVTRISLHGRIGAAMMIGDNYGFNVSVGNKVGRASYTEAGAETSWFPSSMDASMGLVFAFGH
jgi:hypothetical protein